MVNRALPALAVACLTAACEPGVPLQQSSDAPIVWLALSPGPTILRAEAPDSALHAIVATVGDSRTGYWRSIEEFTMRRRSDGRAFDWVITPREGELDVTSLGRVGEDRTDWNVHLAWEGFGGRLGRKDLTPGGTYDLVIRTDGALLTGSVTIPGLPVFTVRSEANTHVVTWDPVSNAFFYWIEGPSGFSGLPNDRSWLTIVRDGEPSDTGWVRLRTFDPQLNPYNSNELTRARILGGAYGIFGAFTIDSFYIPPYQADSPSGLLRR